MKKKIKRLKEYFEKTPEVLMAFVFGSRAKGRAVQVSDWDIGAYFKPKEYLELETEEDYSGESKIWSDLVDILETDNVDFVVLNRARPSLVYNVLRTGIPLTMKDRKLYLELLCKVSYEAMDWWGTVSDYYKISEKANSLSPEARTSLLEHLKFLEEEFGEITEIKKFTQKDYLKNSFTRKIVEKWVENLVMAAIDIAKIILASEKREIPQSYKDILKVFTASQLNFPLKEAERFAEFAKLRNIVAHEYLDIRWKRIESFIKEAEELYSKFIGKTKGLIK
jgi:uncharacterized protein YutE (UPF0331/DUF86 family)/predicted nucleotidyltransferase